jgi:hypothetical protein
MSEEGTLTRSPTPSRKQEFYAFLGVWPFGISGGFIAKDPPVGRVESFAKEKKAKLDTLSIVNS